MNKFRWLNIILVFLMILPLFTSCNNSNQQETSVSVSADDDGFTEFYEAFHTDSTYQLDHITFPLEGLPSFADSMLVNYGKHYYKKEGWKMLHKVDWDTSTMFTRTLEPTGLGVVNEYICTPEKYCISRRFAKLHDGWYLIYYADMNYRPDL